MLFFCLNMYTNFRTRPMYLGCILFGILTILELFHKVLLPVGPFGGKIFLSYLKINHGDTALFWLDKWKLGDLVLPLQKRFPRLFSICKDTLDSVKAGLDCVDVTSQFSIWMLYIGHHMHIIFYLHFSCDPRNLKQLKDPRRELEISFIFIFEFLFQILKRGSV